MAASQFRPHLIDRLRKPRGRLTAYAPLGPQTWFRTGGNAEVLFRPADIEDLASFLHDLPGDVPVTVLGVGSNLLVRDGGLRGVVVRLMRGFTGTTVEGHEVTAGQFRRRYQVQLQAYQGAYGDQLNERMLKQLGVDRQILQALVGLVHGLGCEAVAEGVETAAEAEVLRILGCDAIQGWAIAHPMDAPALARWLDGRRIGVGGR